jgi:hypothetical protein
VIELETLDASAASRSACAAPIASTCATGFAPAALASASAVGGCSGTGKRCSEPRTGKGVCLCVASLEPEVAGVPSVGDEVALLRCGCDQPRMEPAWPVCEFLGPT